MFLGVFVSSCDAGVPVRNHVLTAETVYGGWIRATYGFSLTRVKWKMSTQLRATICNASSRTLTSCRFYSRRLCLPCMILTKHTSSEP